LTTSFFPEKRGNTKLSFRVLRPAAVRGAVRES